MGQAFKEIFVLSLFPRLHSYLTGTNVLVVSVHQT